MPTATVNGARLFYELTGSGEPLVLVHGSWVDHTSWQTVAGRLAESFRVAVYDRRGHSQSEQPNPQGSVHEDADDLGALIEELDLAPAHVATNSFGGNIAMRLAVKRPELFRSLAMHEPPVLQLLAGNPDTAPLLERDGQIMSQVVGRIEQGDHEGAARQFVEELAFRPGAWENELPPPVRELFIRNAATFLDETRDPDGLGTDLEGLASFERPTLLTGGTESPPIFPPIIATLAATIPNARTATYEGAGHAPHLTHPDDYVGTVGEFAASP